MVDHRRVFQGSRRRLQGCKSTLSNRPTTRRLTHVLGLVSPTLAMALGSLSGTEGQKRTTHLERSQLQRRRFQAYYWVQPKLVAFVSISRCKKRVVLTFVEVRRHPLVIAADQSVVLRTSELQISRHTRPSNYLIYTRSVNSEKAQEPPRITTVIVET